MAKQTALDLMQSAWAARRGSFDADPLERRAALTAAQQDLIKAAAMLRDEGPRASYAQALHLRAHVEMDLGHERQALSLWEEAVSVLRQTDDVLGLAHKLRHLGDLHRHGDRLEQAEALYAEALTLYRRHDGPGSLDFANAVSRMADLKERVGDHVQALALWGEARELYAAADLSAGVEEAERHMAGLKAQRGETP